MIKLSDVKVRPIDRVRVRYRLLVLEYAGHHGPTAAGRHYGISARTIRRWGRRWRSGGLAGLVPSYPRHRQRRLTPAVIELIRQARQECAYGAARTRLWLQRMHGVRLAMGTIQRVLGTSGCPGNDRSPQLSRPGSGRGGGRPRRGLYVAYAHQPRLVSTRHQGARMRQGTNGPQLRRSPESTSEVDGQYVSGPGEPPRTHQKGPMRRTLWPPAAAISSARLACA
jgi:transposase